MTGAHHQFGGTYRGHAAGASLRAEDAVSEEKSNEMNVVWIIIECTRVNGEFVIIIIITQSWIFYGGHWMPGRTIIIERFLRDVHSFNNIQYA